MAQVHGDVDAGHQLPEPALVHPALAHEPFVVQAEALEPAVEVEARRGRPDEEQRRLRMARAHLGERAQELGNPLARVDDAEATDDGPRSDALRLDVGHRPGRMRNHPDRALVSGSTDELVHGLRVDDEPGRVLEHEPRERKVLGPGLPERRDALVEDAVREQPADDSVLALHRVEVAVAVATADRHPGDEVVDDEVVQDDDTRPPAQRVDDPGVSVGVVADVVERRVGAARSALAPLLDDRHVEPLPQGRQRAARCSPRRPSSRAASARSTRASCEQPLDRALPGHLVRDRLPGPPERRRLVAVRA